MDLACSVWPAARPPIFVGFAPAYNRILCVCVCKGGRRGDDMIVMSGDDENLG